MKEKLGATFLVFLFVVVCKGQAYQKNEFGVNAQINAVNVEIQFYSPSTVRVVKYPEGGNFSKQSLSVIQTPQKINFNLKQQGDELILTSDKHEVLLNLKNAMVSFSGKSISLLSEMEAGNLFTGFDDAGVKAYTVSQSFIPDKDEHIHGLGQQ